MTQILFPIAAVATTYLLLQPLLDDLTSALSVLP